MVSSTPQPHFTLGKDQVPFYGRLGGTPRAGLDGRIISPPRDSIPDRPARSSVVIPTELPGPQILANNEDKNLREFKACSRYMKFLIREKWRKLKEDFLI